MAGIIMNSIQRQWLVENAKDYCTYSDLTNAFNDYFGLNYKQLKIEDFCRANKIKKKMNPLYNMYSEEQLNWLKTHRENYISMQEFTDDFNTVFGTSFSKNTIQQTCLRHNIFRSDKKIRCKYTKEFNEWVKENIDNYSYEEICEIAKEKFNLNSTPDAISSHIHRNLKIYKKNDGRFTIEKAHEIGKEYVRLDAVYIKVKHDSYDRHAKSTNYRNNFRRKANVMYEKYHNVVLDDSKDFVVCIDKNIHNFDKDNLLLLNKTEFRMYIGKRAKYDFADAKCNKLLLDVIRLEHILNENRKK